MNQAQDWWRIYGKKATAAFGVLFAGLWAFSGKDDEVATVPAVARPLLPAVPVTDARLYVPVDLPGMKVQRGFIGTGDSPREARISGKVGLSRVTILASSLGELLDSTAGQPIKVGSADGYSSKSGDGQAVTWKRGEVMLRVSVSHPALDDAGMIEAAKGHADEINTRADRVIAMTADDRAEAIAALGSAKDGL